MKVSYVKMIKSLLIGVTLTSMMVLMSCGEEEEGVTQGQQILEAIEGTWTFTTEGIPSDAEVSNPSITVAGSAGSGSAGFVPDVASGLSNYISGGSFSVADDGTISNASVIPATGSNIAISGAKVVATTEILEISFSTSEASSREAGLGSWTISISLN